MARVAFTLRRGNVGTSAPTDLGSFLRFDDDGTYDTSGSGGSPGVINAGDRLDYDSALRADSLQIAPIEFDAAFFEAASSCYGEVDLNWGVSIVTELTAEPLPYGVVLVYSDLGEPQTIASGNILVESSSTFEYAHSGVPEGRWAYYSLFVNYRSSNGDDYYERVASLDVLVPKDYGSTLLLWERIPDYYRTQDISLGVPVTQDMCLGTNIPSDGVVGPLYRFLSIIGFDMDRIRTTIDYMMQAKDPFLANSETLDAIADMLAVEMRTNDLGAARLRGLLNDIGYFRRSKGTEDAIEFYAKAISGSDIAIDQATKEITVYSQRVNFITRPNDPDGNLLAHRRAHVDEVLDYDQPLEPMVNAGEYERDGVSFYPLGGGSASAGYTHVLIRVPGIIPVEQTGTDKIAFSIHSGVGTEGIKWARLMDTDDVFIGIQDTPVLVDGVRTWEITGTLSGFNPGFVRECWIDILVDLTAVPQIDVIKMLAERRHFGSYFDGNTVRGGWLIDASSVSDYRWEGSANDSRSLYAEDYERTKAILDALLFESFPVNQADDYTIVKYNGVPLVD